MSCRYDAGRGRASFLEVQQELLKDGGDYRKTRYEIITLSLKKIIESDTENLQKLLMLSMMDSQDIPKDMLSNTSEGMKAPGKADKFIREMMKHSLVTMGMASGDIGTLSMHRSTWEIMYAYLVNSLKLSPSHPLVRKVIFYRVFFLVLIFANYRKQRLLFLAF